MAPTQSSLQWTLVESTPQGTLARSKRMNPSQHWSLVNNGTSPSLVCSGSQPILNDNGLYSSPISIGL
eukprot:1925827-Lingulodinium_polyedra.AAC.1